MSFVLFSMVTQLMLLMAFGGMLSRRLVQELSSSEELNPHRRAQAKMLRCAMMQKGRRTPRLLKNTQGRDEHTMVQEFVHWYALDALLCL